MSGLALLAVLGLFAATADAIDFANALPCNSEIGAKPGAWCLEGGAAKGRKVTFLENKSCHAVTGAPAQVLTEEVSFQGTALEQFDCPITSGSWAVVLDTDVKTLEKLEVRPVAAERIPKGLERKIRAHPFFEKLLVRDGDLARLGPPVISFHVREVIRKGSPRRTLVATFTEDGELPFLIQGGQVTPLAVYAGTEAANIHAIRFNGQDYLVMNLCNILGEGCGESYTEIH